METCYVTRDTMLSSNAITQHPATNFTSRNQDLATQRRVCVSTFCLIKVHVKSWTFHKVSLPNFTTAFCIMNFLKISAWFFCTSSSCVCRIIFVFFLQSILFIASELSSVRHFFHVLSKSSFIQNLSSFYEHVFSSAIIA